MDGADGAISPTTTTSQEDATDGAEAALRRVDVQELMHGQRELILTLQETEYRLRITSNGKLILTK